MDTGTRNFQYKKIDHFEHWSEDDLKSITITNDNINFVISACEWIKLNDIQKFIYDNLPFTQYPLDIDDDYMEKYNFNKHICRPTSPGMAVIIGNVRLLRECYNHGMIKTPTINKFHEYNFSHLCNIAITSGFLNCLKLLFSWCPQPIKPSYYHDFIKNACQNGHLSIILFIKDYLKDVECEAGCYYMSIVEDRASTYLLISAEFGHFELVQYFNENYYCEMSEQLLNNAILSKNQDIVIYCVTHGCPFDHSHIDLAKRLEETQMVEYLTNVLEEINNGV